MMSSSHLNQSSENDLQLTQLPAMVWQWRRVIVATTILGLALSGAASFLMEDRYRSSALLVVESAQIPTEPGADAQAEMVDRRVARIRQLIMSRPNLTSLIAKYGLYGASASEASAMKYAKLMRSAIVLEPAMGDLPGSLARQNTVAVRLSFDYSDPAKAKAVAQDLMQNLLNMDANGNVQQANNTVEFLSDQAKTLELQIADIQNKMTQISGANGRVLASQGITMMGGGGGSYDVQIAALQRDTAALIAQKEAMKGVDSRNPAISAAESQLAAARAIYSENHPDVVLAKQRLAQARQMAQAMAASAPSASIDNQIAFNNSQIMALRAAKGQEQAQVASNMSAMSRAPMVEQQIAQLQQQLTGLNSQYQSVSSRLLAARAGVKGGAEQGAERLSVAEPPVVPTGPESPNRPLIIALGSVAGMLLGLAVAFMFEVLFRPVRSPATLAKLTGIQPLGVVPYIFPLDAPKRRWSFSMASFWSGLKSDVLGIFGRNPR